MAVRQHAVSTSTFLPARRRAERGMVAIFVAIVLVVIFGFVGLAIDSGHVRAAGGQLQDSADSAALAAAEALANEVQLVN